MLDPSLLQEIRLRLIQAFGERLQGIVLYGSRVRGDAEPDSDLDVFVLVAGPIHLGKDLTRIVEALYPLQLRLGLPIHGLPVTAEQWGQGTYAVYREAQREGLML